MAPKVYDRVKEYTVSTGIGGITFVGAFNGFQKFSDVLTSGDTTYYVIEENDKWEVGIGTYGSNNLDRTTVLTSSNNGNKVSLGGSGVVSITYPAGRAAFSDEVDYVSGVAVYSSGQAIINKTDISSVSSVANYASGQAIQNGADIVYVSGLAGGGSATVDQVNYVSGIAVYSSGQAITNKTDISTNSSDISYVSGVANYASGQAVDNESQISSVSGWADSTFLKSDDDTYVSGVAVYASGQSIENESDIATNTSNISTNTSNISTNTARVNYASGQAIANESDIATNTSNISTNTSNISTNTARVAYASGQAIENESQISSVSGWASVYADAGDVSVSGWASSTFLSSDDDSYVSGVAVYASGQAIANESDIATNTSNISTNTSNISDNTAKVTYASGQAIENEADIVYISGIAVYASGNTGGAAYDDTYLSGIAVYSSGQAIENESQISSVSGWAGVYADAGDASVSGWADSTFIKVDDDSYVSGIAAYASGQAIENESLATYASGQAIENETDIVYISGIAVYASGNTLQRVTDNGASTTNAITITNNNITASSGLFDVLDMTPLGNGDQPAYQEGVVFYDSENHTLTLYNDEADISLQIGQEQYVRARNNTATTIENGTAVLFNGVHGNSAPTISGAIATSEATSQVIGLATHSIEPNSFGYVTTYGIVRDVDTSVFSAGDELYLSATQIGSGVNVSPTIPNFKVTLGHVITSSSSNGSILVQIGNAKLGGGDVKSEAPLNVSGVPFITSVSDTTAGGSLTDPLFIFDSGNRQLQLASGVQLLDGAPTNTSNVLYNEGGTLKFNGSAVDTTYDDTYVSGVAVYASGQAISNETDISYVSGVATKTFTVTAADSSNYTFDGMGLNSDTDPTIYLHKGHTYYFDKQTASHPFRVSASDGGAVYQDADGNNIEITGQGVLKFEVPQDAPDKLYYYCTSHPSAMKGEIYTTTNVDDISYVSGIAVYASGEAGGGSSLTAGSGIVVDGANRINVHSGSGHFLNLEVEDTLNISGVATFDQVSTFQSGVKTNINTEADAATITFDMDQSNVHMVTLGDNRTLAVSNVDVGQKFLIRLQQDSTGSRTVTWWNDIKWAEGGTEPTLTTTAGKADLFGFLSPSGGYYDGFVVGQNI